tara:strand:+ start:666 stop:884 length:219 start_codon:yes stop_codon:yes gene_type:complete
MVASLRSALLDSRQAIKELFNEEYNDTTRSRLRRLIKAGHIKVIRVGERGDIYVPAGEITKFHQVIDLDNSN